jgi:phenylpyruvate tautomerase PptA (4-oxalocrotonate tautomerase family)
VGEVDGEKSLIYQSMSKFGKQAGKQRESIVKKWTCLVALTFGLSPSCTFVTVRDVEGGRRK